MGIPLIFHTMSTTITIEVPDTFAGLSEQARAEMIAHLEAEAREIAFTRELAAEWETLKDKPESFWHSIPVDALDESN